MTGRDLFVLAVLTWLACAVLVILGAFGIGPIPR